MKSIKARIQGFAVLPLLVVVFLLAISALGTYIVVKQGTSGYGTRAAGNTSAITTVSRSLNGTTYSCKRVNCDKWVNISSPEPRGSSCRAATDSSGLSVCKWVNTNGIFSGGTDQCDVSNEYRGGALQKERLSQSLVKEYNESSENYAYFNCTTTQSPSTCNVGYGQQCGSGKCQGGGTANCSSPYSCVSGTCRVACPDPASCGATGKKCCSCTLFGQQAFVCAGDYECSSQTASGTCKRRATVTDPKTTITPTPFIGGGGSCQTGYVNINTTCVKAATSDVPCATGYHKVNNVCMKAASSEAPCATGYIKVSGCVRLPTSNTPCSSTQVNVNGTCVSKSSATVTPTDPKPATPTPGSGGGGGGGGGGTNPSTPTPTTTTTTTTPTTVPGTSGDATLAFKLKFQGVGGYPKGGKTVPFKVKLQGPTSTGYQSGTLTVNNQGVWEGNVSFTNIVVGSSTKYTVFVKVGKHLQKRVCAFAPSEASGGTYNCSESNMPITAGTNNLDFSGILMLVGDLPSSTGEQNGVVDSYDISYVLNHLGSTVESELAIGDLNFDGVIDTQDRSLIIQSLNVKYDDQ